MIADGQYAYAASASYSVLSLHALLCMHECLSDMCVLFAPRAAAYVSLGALRAHSGPALLLSLAIPTPSRCTFLSHVACLHSALNCYLPQYLIANV